MKNYIEKIKETKEENKVILELSIEEYSVIIECMKHIEDNIKEGKLIVSDYIKIFIKEFNKAKNENR